MSSRLAADEPLPACSEAERLAANDFADQLRGSGREVAIETIWLRPAWWLVQAICSAAAVIASVVCVSSPTAGLAIAIIAAFFSLSDATRLAPLRRLTSKRASQNVISAPPARSQQPATMLILTAASDDRPVAANRFIPSSLIATNASCIALIAACAALRSAGIDVLAVSQYAEHGKQVGSALDLIDDNEAAQRVEGQSGRGQAIEVSGILEVEVVQSLVAGKGAASGNTTSQSGLARLPGAKQCHHFRLLECSSGGICKMLPEHGLHITMKYQSLSLNFHKLQFVDPLPSSVRARNVPSSLVSLICRPLGPIVRAVDKSN